jgi:type I restriction enzyme R subunit
LKDYQKHKTVLNTNEKRDAFAKDFSSLTKLWEALSPDPVLNQFEKDYKWLSQVYTSVKPASDDNGRLLWHALGAQTTALIHEHIHVSGINHDMEEMILDAEVIDDLMNKKDPKTSREGFENSYQSPKQTRKQSNIQTTKRKT